MGESAAIGKKPNRAYDIIEKKFRKDGKGNATGYGLKIFPKKRKAPVTQSQNADPRKPDPFRDKWASTAESSRVRAEPGMARRIVA
jgi:hypothetical protein